MDPEGPVTRVRDGSPDSLLKSPASDADSFFRLMNHAVSGARTLAAIRAGICSGIFMAFQKPVTPEEVAGTLGMDVTVLTLLCEVYVETGLFSRDGRQYRNTAMTSAFLIEDSPFSQVSYVVRESRSVYDTWAQLSRILVWGPDTIGSGEFFVGHSLIPMAENARAGRIQETLAILTRIPGFSRIRRILDLGGGHGLYAIALSHCLPLSEAYVMDLPEVIPLTQSYITAFGATRVHAVAGNFFTEPFGTSFDLVFSSSNPSGKQGSLLPKIAACLSPGGYFADLQPDGMKNEGALSRLDWNLWTLDGVKKGQGHYSKESPFPDEGYRSALASAGLTIRCEHLVRDRYRPDFWLRLVVAQKSGSLPLDGNRHDSGTGCDAKR